MPSTSAKSADAIVGLEFDWLASDVEGHVALFSTAGGGYAPPEFLLDTEAHDAAIDAILAMPASTAPRFAPELAPGLHNTWRTVAERGLFAFDSDPHGGPYRMVAAPVEPLHVGDLPEAASQLVERLVLRRVRFSNQATIGNELLNS